MYYLDIWYMISFKWVRDLRINIWIIDISLLFSVPIYSSQRMRNINEFPNNLLFFNFWQYISIYDLKCLFIIKIFEH